MNDKLLLPRMAALIVEDQPMIAASLEATLHEFGVEETYIAHGVASALAMLEHKIPSLAFIDWQLGPTTSADLLVRLKSLGIAVIMMTGFQENWTTAQNENWLVVLEKPFGEREVRAALIKVLSAESSH